MTDPIDYSRPVGWWCPVCTRCAYVGRTDELKLRLGLLNCCPSLPVIPRYLPIPRGQRPPAASEVEEAEVCTGQRAAGAPCCYVSADAVFAPDNHWDAEIVHLAEYADADHINDIAQASARARIVTGATE